MIKTKLKIIKNEILLERLRLELLNSKVDKHFSILNKVIILVKAKMLKSNLNHLRMFQNLRSSNENNLLPFFKNKRFWVKNAAYFKKIPGLQKSSW